MAVWSYANIWEPLASRQPYHPAIIQGDRTVSWGEFEAHADALAAVFLRAGLTRQAKVASYLTNSPEYLTTYYAAFKAGLAPLNVNYRYGADELHYLFANADAEAIVFHAIYSERLAPLRERLPLVKSWIAVTEPGVECPPWALNYADIVADLPAQRPVRAPWGRSNDDIVIVYTGGTTGMPKGVMWRQEDLLGVMNFGGSPLLGIPPLSTPEEAAQRIETVPRNLTMIACPLMHATGLLVALGTLITAGTCVLLPSRHFDAVQLWSEVERHRVTRMAIAGQPFSGPMVEALEQNPGRWDLSRMQGVFSSGAMWSYENKRALLRVIPGALLTDAFASSEAGSMGASISTAGGESATAKFMLTPNCAVFTESFQRVTPGSGERGLVATTGYLPLGYYKDEEKTKRTFPIIEGKRWSMPGDWATVNADGALNVLGRGSQCINTGGEKVFPEEVEEALKLHPTVRDAAVIGAPDPRFGETICAVIELREGVETPTLAAIASHVRERLAGYKAPRALVVVDAMGRAPNGKLDYKAIKARALSELGIA